MLVRTSDDEANALKNFSDMEIRCGENQRIAFYFRRVNVGCGPAEERVLLTGLHAVADIYCECCKTTLGWKYVSTTVDRKYRGIVVIGASIFMQMRIADWISVRITYC